MRETCGAACGMFLLAGLETGATDGADREGKGANYALVQQLAGKFKEKNGALRCADLLGLTKRIRLWLLRKYVPPSITPSVLVRKWWKRLPEYGEITWKSTEDSDFLPETFVKMENF